MDHKTMNTGTDTTMNGTMPNNGGSRSMNGRMTKTGSGLGQGVLWLGATALAIVGAKYAWQRARQSLGTNNPKYLETAERMIDSVVDGSITN